ncbi:unnamed protein product [Effrenium voratum]|uniref:Uncharacterized protein n=1 Tax=Effrenium voratum TaxID=2562239 RepID=A0AA36JN48_9DINO|nr:unnamed protein product [Effrenium voratum]CAJ1408107.1 unnamed protein product [Effrenium voratum]
MQQAATEQLQCVRAGRFAARGRQRPCYHFYHLGNAGSCAQTVYPDLLSIFRASCLRRMARSPARFVGCLRTDLLIRQMSAFTYSDFVDWQSGCQQGNCFVPQVPSGCPACLTAEFGLLLERFTKPAGCVFAPNA